MVKHMSKVRSLRGTETDINTVGETQGADNKKSSPRLIITLILTGVMALSVGLLFLIQQLSNTSASAFLFLQIVTLITIGMSSAIIIVNVILSSVEARGARLEIKKQTASTRFPVGLFRRISQPTAICEPSGKLIWGNSAFCKLISEDSIIDGHKLLTYFDFKGLMSQNIDERLPADTPKNAGDIFSDTVWTPISTQEQYHLLFEKKRTLYMRGVAPVNGEWFVSAHDYFSNNSHFYMLVLTDVTDLVKWRNDYNAERMVCAYICIDNLDELVSREHESYRKASSEVDKQIKGWAQKYNAVIKEYDRDKYIMFFTYEALEAMEEDKFSQILDNVRKVTAGSENLPVTVSVGISRYEGDLISKERSAQSALDVALRRGGNQVIVNGATDAKCFGAKTLTVQSRSNVHYRTFAEKLAYAIQKSHRVLIMGHRNPDFDAIGSCAGIARLVHSYNKEFNIVMDEKDPNVFECIKSLKKLPMYENAFVSTLTGMDNNKDTNCLVICCDVNNTKQFEAPDIVSNANTLFIIDHHRQNDFTPKMSKELEGKKVYEFLIIPSASSASELVSEMLRYALPSDCHLATEEADIMFAGILLDTKQFTRNTQPDTFRSALYLRRAGADPSRAQSFFRTELEDFKREALFSINVSIEHGCIAIATENGNDPGSAKRVSAARAADRLLGVKNVQASFVATQIESDVFISARSDGTINVQLIMESLNGGGHYNAAATTLKDVTIEKAATMLKEAIDKYLGYGQQDKPAKNKKGFLHRKPTFTNIISNVSNAIKREKSTSETADSETSGTTPNHNIKKKK